MDVKEEGIQYNWKNVEDSPLNFVGFFNECGLGKAAVAFEVQEFSISLQTISPISWSIHVVGSLIN